MNIFSFLAHQRCASFSRKRNVHDVIFSLPHQLCWWGREGDCVVVRFLLSVTYPSGMRKEKYIILIFIKEKSYE